MVSGITPVDRSDALGERRGDKVSEWLGEDRIQSTLEDLALMGAESLR